MAKQLRQARAAARAAYNWLQHDLPEIVAPASIPNPPGFKPPPRKTQGALLPVRCVCILPACLPACQC
jgi:hypothetical protein